MRILLDENFPKSAVDVVEAAGHEVIPFVDVCEFGADDEVVFESAQNLGAVILTSDRFLSHSAIDSSRALRYHCRGLATAESKCNPDTIAMVL